MGKYIQLQEIYFPVECINQNKQNKQHDKTVLAFHMFYLPSLYPKTSLVPGVFKVFGFKIKELLKGSLSGNFVPFFVKTVL